MPTEMSSVRADIATAERHVTEALSYHTPGERLAELLRVWRISPEDRRDALFAVLAFRLTLIPPEFRRGTGAAA